MKNRYLADNGKFYAYHGGQWCEEEENDGHTRSGGQCETREPPPPDKDADKPPLEYIRTKLQDAEVSLGQAKNKAESVGDRGGTRDIGGVREALREVRRQFGSDVPPRKR